MEGVGEREGIEGRSGSEVKVQQQRIVPPPAADEVGREDEGWREEVGDESEVVDAGGWMQGMWKARGSG